MAIVNMEISREVERQLQDSLDIRFDLFSAQFTEQLALLNERIDELDKKIDGNRKLILDVIGWLKNNRISRHFV